MDSPPYNHPLTIYPPSGLLWVVWGAVATVFFAIALDEKDPNNQAIGVSIPIVHALLLLIFHKYCVPFFDPRDNPPAPLPVRTQSPHVDVLSDSRDPTYTWYDAKPAVQPVAQEESGIIFTKEIHAILEEVPGMCPVCNTTLEEPLHKCRECKTYHHADCWEYNNGCAIYGCRSRK